MAAGKLRERVTFQRRAIGGDGYGNERADWTDLFTVWGDMLERLGGEKIAAGQIESSRMTTIRVYASAATGALTEADRIMARGQPWNIRSIAAVGRKGELLEMLCEAGVAT